MALCGRCILFAVIGFAIAFGLIALLDLGVYTYFAYQVNRKYGTDLFTKRRQALDKVLSDSKARMMIDPIAVYRRNIDEKLKKLK